MSYWISSLTSFASHIGHIQDRLKAVCTREEALDEMRLYKKSLIAKTVSAKKKLNKMGMDNKSLRQQSDLLMSLREYIRKADAEIMYEEATLGHWKRVQVREWMSDLFDGLLECSETGSVVATFGCTIIGYVSTEKNQPGLPQANYSGRSQVESLVAEAVQKLQNTSFAGEASGDTEQPLNEGHTGTGDIPGHPPLYYGPSVQQIPTHPPERYSFPTLPNSAPSSPLNPDDFGRYSPYLRSQPSHLSSLDPPSPTSPTIFGPSNSSQGSPRLAPGHQVHLSQSSTLSRSNPILEYIANHAPFVPVLQFRGAPEIQEVRQTPFDP